MDKSRDNKVIIKEEDAFKYLEEESIYIEDFFNTKVDLSLFLKIKHLAGYHKQMINLDRATSLEILMIWNYNYKKNEIQSLPNLNTLCLRQGNVINLSFLKDLSNIQKLELSCLSKLIDISSLEFVSEKLETLEIETCKKIESIEVTLIKLEKLKVLKLIGLQINDIGWVRELSDLKQLIIIDSNVLSGDISPAKDIDYVAIDNKRHYNYKFDKSSMKIVPRSD